MATDAKLAFNSDQYVRFIAVAAVLGLLIAATWGIRQNFRAFAKGCSPHGYSKDKYLAYCEDASYGDYEHGALYFDQQPEATKALRGAQIVFLGNSRMQFELSTNETEAYFAQAKIPYYLLGFGFDERYHFALDFYQKLKLHPNLVVVNIDERFFIDMVSGPAQAAEKSWGYEELRVRFKGLQQEWHQQFCGHYDGFFGQVECGNGMTLYRSRLNGSWDSSHFRPHTDSPIEVPATVPSELVDSFVNTAKDFVTKLRISPGCVIFISNATAHWNDNATATLAASAGAQFVPVLGDRKSWTTLDTAHLIAPDASAYSQSALQALGPTIEKCVAKPGSDSNSRIENREILMRQSPSSLNSKSIPQTK